MKPGVGESFRSTNFASRLKAFAAELEAAAQASLKIYLRYPAWLIADVLTTPAWLVLILVPILLFLPKSQWSSPQILSMLFWGFIFWDVVGAGLWSFGAAVRREQQMGTLEPLLLTNANRAILFSRDFFSRSVALALSLAYVYAFFTVIFGVNPLILNPVGVAASLLLGLLASMGFGLVYGALVLRFKNVGPLNNVLQFVIMGLCGAFVPVTSLPEALRVVSYAIPHTYAVDLLRHYGLGTPTLLPTPQELLLLTCYTATLLSLGFTALKRVERALKRTGQLGAY